jgi:hypothetical protein
MRLVSFVELGRVPFRREIERLYELVLGHVVPDQPRRPLEGIGIVFDQRLEFRPGEQRRWLAMIYRGIADAEFMIHDEITLGDFRGTPRQTGTDFLEKGFVEGEDNAIAFLEQRREGPPARMFKLKKEDLLENPSVVAPLHKLIICFREFHFPLPLFGADWKPILA